MRLPFLAAQASSQVLLGYWWQEACLSSETISLYSEASLKTGTPTREPKPGADRRLSS